MRFSRCLGWLTVSGWVAAITAGAFFVGSLIQAVVIQNHPDFTLTGWQGTLLFYAVLLLCVTINTASSKALPVIEILVLILHIIGFFAILIPLVYLAPHSDAKSVFTLFSNGGGWNTQALSFFIGLNGNAVAFLGKSAVQKIPSRLMLYAGTDGAVHVRSNCS